MIARITNVWAAKRIDDISQRGISRVVVESVGFVKPRIKTLASPLAIAIEFPDSALNMPAGLISVYDGLILNIEVERAHRESVELIVTLEHPTAHSMSIFEGTPARVIVDFDRSPLAKILGARVIAIDPGHGGFDQGSRGPVNLLEKNVVLDVGHYLRGLLLEAGAMPVMTRQGDYNVPAGKRLKIAREKGAEMFVSIHTYSSRDVEASGPRVIYHPGIEGSKELATLIYEAMIERMNIKGRGIVQSPTKPLVERGVPYVMTEIVAISNWVEEGMLRSPVVKERIAEGIFNGIERFYSRSAPSTQNIHKKKICPIEKIPVRTHIITEGDDIVEVIERYVKDVVKPGDIITVAESVVAIAQGRAILPKDIKPGRLARFLCRFPGKDGSLATPPAMQLAINEAGSFRVLLGAVAAGFGRVMGRRGDFYRVVGHNIAAIDDIAGTMPSYDKHVVLGPRDPQSIVNKVKERLGVEAAIVDANDMGRVDILARTEGLASEELVEALEDNPFGNDDQQTPIVILRR